MQKSEALGGVKKRRFEVSRSKMTSIDLLREAVADGIDPLRVLKVIKKLHYVGAPAVADGIDPLRVLKARLASGSRRTGGVADGIDPLRVLKVTFTVPGHPVPKGCGWDRPAEGTERTRQHCLAAAHSMLRMGSTR